MFIQKCMLNTYTDPYTHFVNSKLNAQFFFLYLFIAVIYMFRATNCSSSGESIVSIRPLVHVTYIQWYIPEVLLIQLTLLMFHLNLHTACHLHTVTYTRGRIDTIDSPDVPSKLAHHTVTYIQWHIPEVVLIQVTLLMFHLNLHTTQSPTYSDIYQRSYWYKWLSWCSI